MLKTYRECLVCLVIVAWAALWAWLVYSRPRSEPSRLTYPVHFGLEPMPHVGDGDPEPPLIERHQTWPHPRTGQPIDEPEAQ